MDWDDVRVFEAIADAPTLSEAARRLKISVATVHRRLEIFESALNLRLVERTHTGVYLTQDGLAVLDRARSAATAMSDIPRFAGLLRQNGEHPVRLSAPEPIAACFLGPALPRLHAANPTLRLQFDIAVSGADPLPRDAEIALRFARPEVGQPVIQRLGQLRFGLYATPAYLDGRAPSEIALAEERLLAGEDHPEEAAWLTRHGLAGRVALRATSSAALLHATLSGLGLGLLPTLLADPHAALVPVPVPEPIPERPLWLITFRDLRGSPRHRAVRAWVLETLQQAGVAPKTRAPEIALEMEAFA